MTDRPTAIRRPFKRIIRMLIANFGVKLAVDRAGMCPASRQPGSSLWRATAFMSPDSGPGANPESQDTTGVRAISKETAQTCNPAGLA